MKKWEGGGKVPNDDDGWMDGKNGLMKKWVHNDDGWMDG
jgi:hypothetical protein